MAESHCPLCVAPVLLFPAGKEGAPALKGPHIPSPTLHQAACVPREAARPSSGTSAFSLQSDFKLLPLHLIPLFSSMVPTWMQSRPTPPSSPLHCWPLRFPLLL